MGIPPTGGAIEVLYDVDRMAVKGRGRGDPAIGKLNVTSLVGKEPERETY